MAYEKNIWEIFNPEIPEDEQPDAFITKKKLDNIEAGIEAAHKLAENATGTPGPQGPQGDKGEVGPEGPAGADGKDGYTPVKGEDYFTEADKVEIVEAVLATQKNEPYFDEELNKFFACGVHINVFKAEEEGKLKITWLENGKAIVPENIDIFGGCASDDKAAYYPASTIAVYGGNIDSVIGGCFGNGYVGNTMVVVNGGKFNYICGGGMHWADKRAHNNTVGRASVILNDAENADCVTGGTPSGMSSIGASTVTVNGGTYGVVMAGGTNGYTGEGEIIVNGGTIRSVQAGNRGTLGNVKITVNDGTITNAVYAGVGDTATFIKSELNILGGNVNKVAAGKYNGAADYNVAERVSGTYVEGVITDEMATAMNLVKTTTIEKLMAKIAELEAVITE